MSRTDVFADSNVLVYLFDNDDVKTRRSEEIIERGVTISVQVLNEFTLAARRKMRKPWPIVREMLAGIRSNCDIVPQTIEVHELGIALAERYGMNVYDAMIVAAALLAGCKTLYSEDMHDGLAIDGLTILNPYRTS